MLEQLDRIIIIVTIIITSTLTHTEAKNVTTINKQNQVISVFNLRS